MIRILDIDNCIADDGWRVPRIEWSNNDLFARYHAYHQLAAWDAPGNFGLFLGADLELFVLTSRPLHYRVTTAEWLRRVGCKFSQLIMRNDNDFRHSLAVKEAQLKSVLVECGVSAIECAYDDRPEIVEMYRSYGLKAEVRSLHDVCAYINPITGVNHADGRRQG